MLQGNLCPKVDMYQSVPAEIAADVPMDPVNRNDAAPIMRACFGCGKSIVLLPIRAHFLDTES